MEESNREHELSVLDRVGNKVFIGDKVAVSQGWSIDVLYVYKMYSDGACYTRVLFCYDLANPRLFSHTNAPIQGECFRIIKLNN